MTDFVREVDEELRRSQAEAMWRRFGPLVIGVMLAVILGVGGWRLWEWRAQQAAEATGQRLERALRDLAEGRAAEARTALEAIATQSDGGAYRPIAALRAAALAADTDKAAAVAMLADVERHPAATAEMRAAATLRRAVLLFDLERWDEARAILEPLAAQGQPLRLSALELLALLAIREGDGARALAQLDSIVLERDAPQALRARADVLMAVARGLARP